jgi:hypothetical protein
MDIPQEEFSQVKIVAEDTALADRISQITDEYKKYFQ